MSKVLKRLVCDQWMERLIRTAARMVKRPPAERIQPILLLPSKKSTPMPISSGSIVNPNPACLPMPHIPKKPNDDETCTWFSTRYPPNTARARPEKKVPIPPGVPPAPRSRRSRMSALASSSSVASSACFPMSTLGMERFYCFSRSSKK